MQHASTDRATSLSFPEFELLESESIGEDLLCHIEQSDSILLSRFIQLATVEVFEVGSLVGVLTQSMTLHLVIFTWSNEFELVEAVLVDLARDAVHQLPESLL